jgi:hypothetical protein
MVTEAGVLREGTRHKKPALVSRGGVLFPLQTVTASGL